MDKIAIISDIHGNLEALNTVLEDIKKRNINKIYCLGDIIAKGTHQQECVDLIRKNCEVVIKGNCDEYFTSNFNLSTKDEVESKRITWNRCKINEHSKEYLRNLPFCYEFYLSGRLVRLIHAHPEKTYYFRGNIDKLERIYELLLPSRNTISQEKADVLIYGHTHVPYVQRMYNRLIINPGSVGNSLEVFNNDLKDGNPLNVTLANYMILYGVLDSKDYNNPLSYELINLPYDIDKELEDNSDNIEYELYKKELKTGKTRSKEQVYESFESRGIDKDKV